MNNEISEDAKLYFQKIVDEKIESEKDYRVRNLSQRTQIYSNSLSEIVKESDFNKDSYMFSEYKNYNGYVRFNTFLKESTAEKLAIINYSIENNIKHDIDFNNYDQIDADKGYITSKVAVNQIFNLSIVVMLIIIITSGGIVSNEHIKGTDKMLLTSPVKRWKVLLGKFIYLIIHCYIIWFIALLLLSLYAGIKFGFSDLFTPKLIFENGKIIEVNYYVNLIRNMFVAGIPIISFISIMFALSTITLKTSLTIGITTIMTCISPFVMVYNLYL